MGHERIVEPHSEDELRRLDLLGVAAGIIITLGPLAAAMLLAGTY